MAISFDAIYGPFKAFFLEKFGATAIHFRFASSPYALADEELLVSQHPEWGPSEALAVERISQLVDGIPALEIDGRRVAIGPNKISDVYSDELLLPAISNAEGDGAQSAIEAFAATKSNALKLLQTASRASLIGPGLFAQAEMSPQGWWKHDATSWTRKTFDIKDTVTSSPEKKPSAIDSFLSIFRSKRDAGTGLDTTTITIALEFSVVRIDRSWWSTPFLDSRGWIVPGLVRGECSMNNGHGVPALPVGFVATRNLKITAPWSASDLANLASSVQFGPFNFDSRVVDGGISHAGIQIVGWLLQDLPQLPPASNLPGSRVPFALTAREVLGYLDVHRQELQSGEIDLRALVEDGFLDGPVAPAMWEKALSRETPLGIRTGMQPDVPSTVVARGRRWIAERDRDAAELVSRALLLMEESEDAYLFRGEALASQARNDAALAAYSAAIELAPGKPTPLVARGELYLAQQDQGAGLADLDAAIALDPAHLDPDANRARTLVAKLRPDAPVPTPPPQPTLPDGPMVATLPATGDFAHVIGNVQVPVLAMFGARWAGPSRQMDKIVDAVAEAYGARLLVLRIDTDTHAALVAQLGIQGIPTFITYRNGAAVSQLVGMVPRARIEELVEQAFAA